MDSVMKQIKFSKVLVQKAEVCAKEKGLTFGEYIRHLVVNDTEMPIETLDEKAEKDVLKSLNDYSNGRYVVLKNKEEIRKHFNGLIKTSKKKK